jgi:UDP-N-acetylglucosamine acyltransferase
MSEVHPSAIVDAGARLAPDVRIGPYCVVGGEVTLDAGVELLSHVVVSGRTSIGAGTRIMPFACLGLPPQDRSFAGEPSALSIGKNCLIREHVTVSPGTLAGGMTTRVGDGCWLMIGCHVAHDCQIGDYVTLSNQVALGGHVRVGDYATLGGLSAVHQYVRIGRHAMIGGMSGVDADVVPYALALGDRARVRGVNLKGLRRRGFPSPELRRLSAAFDVLFDARGTLESRLSRLELLAPESESVAELVTFLRGRARRPICRAAAR